MSDEANGVAGVGVGMGAVPAGSTVPGVGGVPGVTTVPGVPGVGATAPAAMMYQAPGMTPVQQQASRMAAMQQQQSAAVLENKLNTFWTEQTAEVQNAVDFKNHLLPLARIKKIMKSDEDVRMISAEAPVLFAKACEMFILELTHRAWAQTEEAKRRTLQRSDISQAISKTDIFDFLIDIVPRDEHKKEAMAVPGVGMGGHPHGGVGVGTAVPAMEHAQMQYYMQNAAAAAAGYTTDPATAAAFHAQGVAQAQPFHSAPFAHGMYTQGMMNPQQYMRMPQQMMYTNAAAATTAPAAAGAGATTTGAIPTQNFNPATYVTSGVNGATNATGAGAPQQQAPQS